MSRPAWSSANFPVLIHGNASNDPGTTFNPAVRAVAPGARAGERRRLRRLRRPLRPSAVSRLGGRRFDRGRDHEHVGRRDRPEQQRRRRHLAIGRGAGRRQLRPPLLRHRQRHDSLRSDLRSGRPQPQGLGECVFSLNRPRPAHVGKLSVADWFCPTDAAQLNSSTATSARAARRSFPRASSRPKDNFPMMVAAGKEGEVYLLDMNDLGGVGAGPGRQPTRSSPRSVPTAACGRSPRYGAATADTCTSLPRRPAASAGGSSGNLNVFQRVVDGGGERRPQPGRAGRERVRVLVELAGGDLRRHDIGLGGRVDRARR